jgi:hypothetical protein
LKNKPTCRARLHGKLACLSNIDKSEKQISLTLQSSRQSRRGWTSGHFKRLKLSMKGFELLVEFDLAIELLLAAHLRGELVDLTAEAEEGFAAGDVGGE